MDYLITEWFNILRGSHTNWYFFSHINSGWLEMEFEHRYGVNPTEVEQWEWMFLNSERIEVSDEVYEALLKQFESVDS
jgi:hypothetical protein